MIECPVCNSYNPDGVVVCMVCTQPLPKSNPTVFHEYGKSKAKLALFNLEDAVLDNAAATRVAKRKQTKKGRKFDFELAQNLEKDVLIPGAKNFIDDLVQDGFKVAFVSQKSKEHMFRQKEHLQQLGIPLMSDARGVMLYMSTDSKVIKDLKEMYDIQFFFGESEKTAKRARIPGVYRNIEEYTGVRANPYLAPEEGKGAYTLVNPLPNPPLKPKRKKMKNGKYRKEPAKKYVQRFMDDSKMSAEFPDRSQRYAVAMSYAEKFYGPKIYSNPPMGKDAQGGDIMLPSEEAADMREILKAEAEAAFIEKFGKDMSEMGRSPAPPPKTVPPLPPSPPPPPPLSADALALRDFDTPSQPRASSLIHSLPPVSTTREEEEWVGGLSPTQNKHLDDGAYVGDWGNFMVGRIRYMMLKEYGPYAKFSIQDSRLPKGQGTIWELSGVTSDNIRDAFDSVGKKSDGFTEPEFAKIMDNIAIYVENQNATIFRPELKYKVIRKGLSEETMRRGSLFVNPPVSNPPSKKKMKKAKKVYKSFNQKDPVEIKNEMVDVGDVWVSLGKAWCIGYRSGKEGLGDEQKYIHHFGVDEETGKKYEEPELYLSMPEKGKPMLMLKGGGWKVKSADGDISWIYH